jgi:dTMP kinase
MRRRGVFITFEGTEKSGKSTQAKLLSQYLEGLGHKTIFLREPGSTKIGEKIRQILLDKGNDEMALIAEMLLYAAARSQLIFEVIGPALDQGVIVLCDRFLDSTLAYQGYGSGLGLDLIRQVGLIATNGIEPDLTLLLDFWRSADHLRSQAAPDRIERRPDAYHDRVKRGYFSLARREPGRIKVIRVREDRDDTQKEIREVVHRCLLKKLKVRKSR